MRKILFVTYQDYANVSTDIAKSIKDFHPDWDARVCSCVPHPFGYPTPHDLDYDSASDEQKADMAEWIRSGIDVLVWAEEARNPSDYYSFHANGQEFAKTMLFGEFDEVFKNAKTFIFHAGNGYRGWSKDYNRLDRDYFFRQIVSPDLWRLTDNGTQVCFGKPMVSDMCWALSRNWHGDLTVCHSPTNYALKGTKVIDEAMERVVRYYPRVKYKHIGGPVQKGEHLGHLELRAQRRDFHIYIDQFSSVGGIGMSSLEAMSDGLLTLCTTHMLHPKASRNTSWNAQDFPIISLPCPTGDHGLDVEVLFSVMTDLCSGRAAKLAYQALVGAAWVRGNLDPRSFAFKFMESLWLS